MISKLQEEGQRTLTAIGPKFDLEKVIAAGRSILQMLIGRAAMRFPDAPRSVIELSEEVATELDAVAMAMLEDMFRGVHLESYDAADLCVYLSFGPYLATWAPLGFSALYGPIGNCLTIFDQNWEDLDVTPTIFVHSRAKPFERMGRKETKFLAETLRADLHGTEIDFIVDDIDAETVAIRFPHPVFGAGTGRIRILRYENEDFLLDAVDADEAGEEGDA